MFADYLLEMGDNYYAFIRFIGMINCTFCKGI